MVIDRTLVEQDGSHECKVEELNLVSNTKCTKSRSGTLPAIISENISDGVTYSYYYFDHSNDSAYFHKKFIEDNDRLCKSIYLYIRSNLCYSANTHGTGEEICMDNLIDFIMEDSILDDIDLPLNVKELSTIVNFDTNDNKVVFSDGTAEYLLLRKYGLPMEKISSVNISFKEFQHSIYKLLQPTPINKITKLYSVELYNMDIDIYTEAITMNTFLGGYVCGNMKYHVRKDKHLLPRFVRKELAIDRVLVVQTIKYSFLLYKEILTYLNDAIKRCVTSIAIILPAFITLRLLYEITLHLHIYFLTYFLEGCIEDILDKNISNIKEDVRTMLTDITNKDLYLNLREDHRVLLLVHLTFAEIRFSYSIVA